jgi:hypothetical protein
VQDGTEYGATEAAGIGSGRVGSRQRETPTAEVREGGNGVAGEAMSTWRERFAPAIREVILKHKGESENAIRKALRELWDAAGMGERRYHPYKVFLEEVRRQLGKKKPTKKLVIGGPRTPAAGQSSMFTEEQ